MENKKRIKKRVIICVSILVITLFVIFIVFNQKTFINCLTIRCSDFQKVDKNVFMSSQISKSLKDSLMVFIHKAERRNEMFWMIKPVDYTIIFCATDNEIEKYTGHKDIQTISYLTPLGTFIVLSKIGYDIDIISHEMSHSVLLQMVGYKTMRKIPTWFNEGIALQVDFRSIMKDSLLENNYQSDFELLSSISSFEDFHKSNWDETRLHYLKSRYELKHWLLINNNKLGPFLNGIKDIDNFNHYYKDYK